MARIKIADLPLLQDLTPEQLKELFGAGVRGYKPSFEALEDRMLRSITPLGASILSNVNLSPVAYAPVATAAQPAASIIQTNVSSQVQQGNVINAAIQAAADPAAPAIVPANTGSGGAGSLQIQDIKLSAPGLPANDPGVLAITAYVNSHQEMSSGTPFSGAEGTVQPTSDGLGRCIFYHANLGPFQVDAVIMWSRPTGAHAVMGSIFDKYVGLLGAEKFGYPTDDAPVLMGNPGPFTGVTQHFLGLKPGVYGAITELANGRGVYEVHGAIYQAWLKSPVIGLVPLSDEQIQVGGAFHYNDFMDPATGKYWVIVWVPGDTEAHVMYGPIYGKWLDDLGGLDYGTPVGNTTITPAEGAIYSQNFKGGPAIGTQFYATIVDTPWAGVHEIHGVVWSVWFNEGPGNGLTFGYPITDEIQGNSFFLEDQTIPYPGEGLPPPIPWHFNITLDPVTGQMYVIYALDDDPGDGQSDSWQAINPDYTDATLINSELPPGYLDAVKAAYNTVHGGNYTSPGQVSSVGQADTAGSSFNPGVLTFNPGASSTNKIQVPGAFTESPGNLPTKEPSLMTENPYTANPFSLSPEFLAALATPISLPAEYAWLPTQATPVADFTNTTFALLDDNGSTHQFQIQSQTTQLDGSATFTGLWDGQVAVGTLAFDDAGNVHVAFNTDSYSFDGTISGAAGAYHLDGDFTDAAGNAMHVAGDQSVAQVSQVSDFSNVSFSLLDDNGAAHQLQIQAQAAQPDGSATFTGVWDGEDATGTLAYDDAGNVYVTFTTDSYSFDGTISGAAGAYHLDGNFTDATGNATHVAGDQSVAQASQVSDFSNVSFSLLDDNGAAHQLQIQAQAAQPDGSATFTGVWDGEDATGTLAFDDAGNVHVTFSTDSDSFDGTITGTPGSYHLDGNITGADGTVVHAAGDQTPAQAAQVADLTNVAFWITDDNGAAYQLQIQTQTTQADGSATFTGVWFANGSHAGEQINGTVAYDATGNVQITFDYGHGDNFTGTLSGDAGVYHVDGNVTDRGTPVHAAGDQSA